MTNEGYVDLFARNDAVVLSLRDGEYVLHFWLEIHEEHRKVLCWDGDMPKNIRFDELKMIMGAFQTQHDLWQNIVMDEVG